MTAEHQTMRTVFLHPQEEGSDVATERLLNGLGHEVVHAATPDQAMRELGSEPTDLMVLDISEGAPRERLTEALERLPATQRPRAIAIFCDQADEALRSLRQRLGSDRVHLFLKPLHLHGLLNVLRQMEDPAF